MEHCKLFKLLNDSTVSKFATKYWMEIADLSGDQYSVNKYIRFETAMLRSDLFDNSDVYILVKGTTDPLAAAANEDDKAEKNVGLKNTALFKLFISKIDNTLIDNTRDLDTVMPMCNL